MYSMVLYGKFNALKTESLGKKMGHMFILNIFYTSAEGLLKYRCGKRVVGREPKLVWGIKGLGWWSCSVGERNSETDQLLCHSNVIVKCLN